MLLSAVARGYTDLIQRISIQADADVTEPDETDPHKNILYSYIHSDMAGHQLSLVLVQLGMHRY